MTTTTKVNGKDYLFKSSGLLINSQDIVPGVTKSSSFTRYQQACYETRGINYYGGNMNKYISNYRKTFEHNLGIPYDVIFKNDKQKSGCNLVNKIVEQKLLDRQKQNEQLHNNNLKAISSHSSRQNILLRNEESNYPNSQNSVSSNSNKHHATRQLTIVDDDFEFALFSNIHSTQQNFDYSQNDTCI